MAYDWEGIKPDIISVGKALSGGVLPVSGAFANDEVMMNIKPGDHGSTFGGCPISMAVARAAIQTLVEEKMPENAQKMGEILGEELQKIKSPIVKEVRGRGLFWAIETVHDAKVNGNDLAYILMKLGLLTKATHDYAIRLAPALIINEQQIKEGAQIIKEGVKKLEEMNKSK